MRGMRRNAYLNAFVMVGRDLLNNVSPPTTSSEQASCFAVKQDFNELDTSAVPLHVLEQCNLVGGVQCAASALHMT